MLPFGMTIPATVTQRSEIPEGLVNYRVHWSSREAPGITVRFKWNLNFLDRFSGKKNLHQILRISVQWEPSFSMRTDRRNEINGRHSQFCDRAYRHDRLTQNSTFISPPARTANISHQITMPFFENRAAGWTTRDSNPGRDKIFFSSPGRPDRLWMPHPASYAIVTGTFAG